VQESSDDIGDGFICRPTIIGDSSVILSDRKRFVVCADELLTAFMELEAAIHH